MTPGAETSEARGALGAIAGLVFVVAEVPDTVTRCTALVCGTVIVVAYIAARTVLKRAG